MLKTPRSKDEAGQGRLGLGCTCHPHPRIIRALSCSGEEYSFTKYILHFVQNGRDQLEQKARSNTHGNTTGRASRCRWRDRDDFGHWVTVGRVRRSGRSRLGNRARCRSGGADTHLMLGRRRLRHSAGSAGKRTWDNHVWIKIPPGENLEVAALGPEWDSREVVQRPGRHGRQETERRQHQQGQPSQQPGSSSNR